MLNKTKNLKLQTSIHCMHVKDIITAAFSDTLKYQSNIMYYSVTFQSHTCIELNIWFINISKRSHQSMNIPNETGCVFSYKGRLRHEINCYRNKSSVMDNIHKHIYTCIHHILRNTILSQ